MRRLLQTEAWNNWRENPIQKRETEYKIFEQKIENHTLAELAQRNRPPSNEKSALLNNSAICIQSETIKLTIDNSTEVDVDNLKNKNELRKWFSANRIPKRNFHIIEKHQERDAPPRMWHGRMASYLHCSCEKAQELLHEAIGETIDELFAYDADKTEYIVCKYENRNPQNMYHGYHVLKDSDEVPAEIKNEMRGNAE